MPFLARRAELLEETKALVTIELIIEIILYGVDVCNEYQVDAAAREIGEWDILVMNAGYMSPPQFLGSAKLEEWWKVWEVRVC